MKRIHKLSSSFITEIFRSTGGFLSHSELDDFFMTVEREIKKHFFTSSSENNLLRVIQSFFDKNSLIREATRYPHYIEILISAAVNSNYICDILVRDPEFFYWIINPAHLNKQPTEDELIKNLSELTARYKTFESRLSALKSFKRKEILRIAIQDLLRISDLPGVTCQLTLLAKTILDALFKACLYETEKKHSVKFRSKYCIASLGKLGGRELNYSSDTDLIIFYDKDVKHGSRYYSEYLTEAVKLFIDSASRLTDSGYLYRIDFRLRPDGRNSPLCRPIQEYLSYYESRGEAWERQMLIKCDFLSGDFQLYNRFINYVTPFIYPLSHLYSPAEQVSKLKTAIEKNLKNEMNIKLTRGGIRDIEFSVQVLQLLNGGRLENLRLQNTLSAINELLKEKLLTEKEKDVLYTAYILYRKTEHFLQLMNDRQVHTIPEAGEIADKMAFYLGFSTKEKLLKELQKNRNFVRKIYSSIVPVKEDEETESTIFINNQTAEKDLSYLREGKELTGGKSFDQKTQKLFIQLEPLLIKLLSELPDPDLALKNFTFFIKSSGIPSIWYNEFTDINLLRSFLYLCSYNSKGMNLLYSDAELQDFLLSKRLFVKAKLSEMRSFSVKKLILYLSARLVLNELSQAEISGFLTSLLSIRIKALTEVALGTEGYFAAALGSFGSSELTFSSDLDLLFITSGKPIIKEKAFKDLLNKINKEIVYFKADCRLRPEGKTSQLAWDENAYIKYINTRGRIWELQSLTKLRFLCGDKKSFIKITKAIESRIKKEECWNIKQSIREMKKKVLETHISQISQRSSIKRTPGGLIDIEYMLQALILCHPELFQLCRAKKNSEIMDILVSFSESYSFLSEVRDRYISLRNLELFIQCAFDTDKTYFPYEENRRKILAGFTKEDIRDIETKFKKYLQLNSTISERILTSK